MVDPIETMNMTYLGSRYIPPAAISTNYTNQIIVTLVFAIVLAIFAYYTIRIASHYLNKLYPDAEEVEEEDDDN